MGGKAHSCWDPWAPRSSPHYTSFTTTAEYAPGSGTSYASPFVAATAGLLLSSNPAALARRPALMRAILMASAQAHPIRDPDRGGRTIPVFGDEYDDKTGVGAPNGGRAKRILADGTYVYRADLVPSQLGKLATISVQPFSRTRVVMTWDQCPGYDSFAPELTVDFDMVVKAAGASPFKSPALRPTYSNLSFVDTYEVVEFLTADVGGSFDVYVSASQWAACDAEGGVQRARLALGWTQERTDGGKLAP